VGKSGRLESPANSEEGEPIEKRTEQITDSTRVKKKGKLLLWMSL